MTLVRPGLGGTAGAAATRSTVLDGVQVIAGFDAVRALADQIDDLARRCSAPATSRPAWVLATLSLEADRQPWGVLVRRGGLLVAGALFADTVGHGPDLVRLAASGSGHRGALLAVDPEGAQALANGISAALTSRPGPVRLSLGPVHASCQPAHELTRAMPGVVAAPVDPIPLLRQAQSRRAAEYLSGGAQRTLRKAANRMARDGHSFSVAFTRDRARIARMLPILEEIHRDRDHARGRDSELDESAPRLVWHARLRALADEGSLELATAQIGGHLAAYVLGILDRPVYRVLEGHLVTEWARYAPGRLIEATVLQRMLDDDGYHTLDWMTSVAPETLLAANDQDHVIVVRTT